MGALQCLHQFSAPARITEAGDFGGCACKGRCCLFWHAGEGQAAVRERAAALRGGSSMRSHGIRARCRKRVPPRATSLSWATTATTASTRTSGGRCPSRTSLRGQCLCTGRSTEPALCLITPVVPRCASSRPLPHPC